MLPNTILTSLLLFFTTATGGTASTPPLPVVTTPVVNGIDLSLPSDIPVSKQPLLGLGFLDVTKPPFNADPTGNKDATAALQAAVDAGRRGYLVVGIPPGRYVVNDTIRLVSVPRKFLSTVGEPNCNNMAETYPAEPHEVVHCGRTAPAVIKALPGDGAPTGGMTRPRIVLRAGVGLKGPVVLLHNLENDNINMNQVITGVDVEIEAGNPDAIGVTARGAQGVSVQDVRIYAGTAAIGLQGGAGSGGSHIGVTVIGGKVGVDVTSAQPAPTLAGITLVNQTQTALVYDAPGRQTLSVAGLAITVRASATGPAINAMSPLSIQDAVIERSSAANADAAVALDAATATLFLRNVYVRGFDTALRLRNDRIVPGAAGAGAWTRVGFLVQSAPSSQVWANGSSVQAPEVLDDIHTVTTAPPSTLASQHVFPTDPAVPLPPLGPGVCNVKSAVYGAKGDLATDDTAALQRALDDPACAAGVFLPKGYYGISRTLKLRPNTTLLGASRIYSNIVPHASVAPLATASTPAWPLVETGTVSATFHGLSVLVWHHMNSTYAVRWVAGTGVWRESHVNRVDLSPGKIGPAALYNRPLVILEGSAGGAFWNFYQENWWRQGPQYRHLLVRGTDRPLRFYELNTEHSQGEANSEFQDVSGPIRIFGFKGEGNYAQLWFRNCSDVLLLGYGGNASPFPFTCPYPPGYAAYNPTLFRLEQCKRVVLANLVPQASKQQHEKRCGLFDTGFAGTFYDPAVWRAVLEIQSSGGNDKNVSTPDGDWPAAFIRGDYRTMAEV